MNKGLSCIIIRTDSNLLIQSMNNWIKSWRLNGWKTANGQDVKNKDLIVELDKWLKRVQVLPFFGTSNLITDFR